MHRKWIRKCNEKYATSIIYFSKDKPTIDLDKTEAFSKGDFVGTTEVLGASDGNNEVLGDELGWELREGATLPDGTSDGDNEVDGFEERLGEVEGVTDGWAD